MLVGFGLAAFIDETVFHQILHWHHFYDRSTPTAGLVSDGLFHAATWFCIVGGLYLLAHLRRLDDYHGIRWWSGMLIGLGGGKADLFQHVDRGHADQHDVFDYQYFATLLIPVHQRSRRRWRG